MLRRFTGAEKPIHYSVRNALGTAIVKLIDATEGRTELAYKHFNQQISSIVQTCAYCLRCECRQLGKFLWRHAIDNACHEQGAQLTGQFIYRPFQDVSDRSAGHLALPERLLATTLAAPYYLRPLPRVVHLAESSHSRQSAHGPSSRARCDARRMTGKDYDGDFSEFVSIGKLRRRLPVAAKIAFVTAALTMAVGASPMPPGASAFLIKCVSTTGTSSMRIGK